MKKEDREEMTLGRAEELAMETDYAWAAYAPEGNEINKADAGAFFLEGYNYAIKKHAKLAPCGETKHKPARHRVLMAEIERLEAENAELRKKLRITSS